MLFGQKDLNWDKIGTRYRIVWLLFSFKGLLDLFRVADGKVNDN